jgi:hypothetical protein
VSGAYPAGGRAWKVTKTVGGSTVTEAVPDWPSLVAEIATGPPGVSAVTTPLADTLAIAGFAEVQVMGRSVRTLFPASRRVAASWVVAPTGREVASGVMLTLAIGANTVIWALPLLPSAVAVIATGPPGVSAVTTPLADTLAIAGFVEVQVMGRSVRTLFPASRTVAASWIVPPTGREVASGVMLTLATGANTVIWALPLLPSAVAVIATDPPGVSAVTTPLADTLAIAGFVEVQVMGRSVRTLFPTSRRVAASWIVPPTGREATAGVTVIVAIGAGPEGPSVHAKASSAEVPRVDRRMDRSFAKMAEYGLTRGVSSARNRRIRGWRRPCPPTEC